MSTALTERPGERARAAGLWCLLLWVVAPGQTALAQEGGAEEKASPESEAPAKLHRPKLKDFVEAEYPQSALEAGAEGVVVLILSIDAQGRVTAAEVQKGPGHGLRAAARRAAMQFEFRPARRGDTPVRSRIRYRYAFEFPERQPERVAEQVAKAAKRGAGSPADAGGEEPADEQDGGLQAGGSKAGGDQVSAKPAPAGRSDGAHSRDRDELSSSESVLEVTIRGESEGEKLQKSARAVEVIDTEKAARKADDMGEVVASEEGVGVRRTGGLGSGTRFSLNGLNDNQVRFFLDGLPLKYAGFPFGLANVPVNLVERVDIYSGVVPVRLGADALGGAVNLVTADAPAERGLRASYQVGSFDTHRLTLSGQLVGDESGVYARANAFFDYAKNDYPVDVEVADSSGQISEVTARRFHDAYRSAGGGLEVGVTGRDWADRLSARVFAADFSRQLQHNLIMSVPYGEARYGATVAGGTLRWEHAVSEALSVDISGGYNFSRGWLEDTAKCRYDWFGRCTSERQWRGELGQFPSDHRIWEHAAFGRFNTEWQVLEHHQLHLSVAPTYVTRTGEDRAEVAREERDPLAAQRDLMDLVSGLEFESTVIDGKLQNIAFVKDYLQLAATDETLPSGVRVNHDRTTHQIGFGDSLRYQFTDWLRAKASYEWATRLPSAEEIFGNGVRIQPNPELEPERSHNANLELSIDGLSGATGSWRGSAAGFLRRTNKLVVLIGGADSFSYQNVFRARSAGLEAAVGWSSPGGLVSVDLNTTYVDLRNISRKGAFGDFKGDRIPNRPYLYANGTLGLQQEDVFTDGDRLSATWESRYVHNYYRGWASLGRTEFKQVIPRQWRQSVALGYRVDGEVGALSTTLEVQNLTDAKVYDFFGVQRPGRAFYLKMTLEL